MPQQFTAYCPVCGTAFTVWPYQQRDGRGVYCGRACSVRGAQVSPEAAYASRVIKTEACWGWRGDKNRGGYGIFTLNRDGQRHIYAAHRYALERALGFAIPDGWEACHTCDVKACTKTDDSGIYVIRGISRPRFGHLWLGTRADNAADMADKRRQHSGSHHGMAKLSESQVIEILALLKRGGLRHQDIASLYGVSRSSIGHIANGTRWKHFLSDIA